MLFGERFHDAEEVSWRAWLGSMIESTTTLDPQWRTPYHYGGALLRVVGDIDGSTAIFEKCSAELPDDPWCPFSARMNWFLDKDDPERAAEWVHRAAERPEAQRWWKAAAASMRSRVGGRDAAVRYLDAEIERAASEGELHYLQMKRGRLIHEALVESWEGACRSYREATGENLGSPEDPAQLGFELPPNHRGDAWVVGADGVVRSEEAEAERRKQAIRAEQRLVAKPAEKR